MLQQWTLTCSCQALKKLYPKLGNLGELKAIVDDFESRNVKFDTVDQLLEHVTAQQPVKSEAEGNEDKDLVLLNLLYAPTASKLHCLARVLARLDNLGYILAWASAANEENFASDPTGICLVELTRIKLSFKVQLDEKGTEATDQMFYNLVPQELQNCSVSIMLISLFQTLEIPTQPS